MRKNEGEKACLFALLFFIYCVSISRLISQDIWLGERDTNRLGSCDEYGFFQFAQPIGILRFGGVTFPTYLTLSSSPQFASSLMNGGWSLPLFESSAYLLDEKHMVVRMPWGETIDLFQFKSSEFISVNPLGGPNWRATPINEKELKLQSSQGVSFIFRIGKLREMLVRDKCVIRWSEESPNSRVVKSDLGEILASYSRTGNRAIYEIHHSKTELIFGNVPWYTEPCLQQLQKGDQVILDLSYLLKGQQIQLFKSLVPLSQIGSWDIKSGQILEDSLSRYRVQKGGDGKILAIQRDFSDGKSESYNIYKDKGYDVYVSSDGKKITRRFLFAFKTALKSFEVESQNSEIYSRKFSYNESGNVIREIESINGEERVKEFDEKGRIIAIKYQDGKAEQYQFSDSGFLISKKNVDDTLTKFEYGPSGNLVNITRDNKAVWQNRDK